MSRIKLNDLPQDAQISKEEMKKVFGGAIRTVNMANNSLINVNTGLPLSKAITSACSCETCGFDSCENTGIQTNVISQR